MCYDAFKIRFTRCAGFIAIGVMAFVSVELLGQQVDQPQKKGVVSMKSFGALGDGREVTLFTLEVPGGWRATITNYGGILTSFTVPRRDGKPIDIVLGFDSIEGYLAGHPYFGATCGRVSNRIAEGTFDLNGKKYTLAKNNGNNHLHGGIDGFDKKLWKASERMTADGPAVDMEVVSSDGDEGYPGNVTAKVTYVLTWTGELRIAMSATTDAPTIINMVHHSYWNLAGHASGTIEGHELQVQADRYLPVDAGGIPTGMMAEVAHTPFDFRQPAVLSKSIQALPASSDNTNPGGIDHNCVMRNWKPDGVSRKIAMLKDPLGGVTMEILTDQPGIQVYTGNYLDGTIKGKEGAVYAKHSGICLETQKYPDSIHHSDWPTTVLNPNETYRHTMALRFTK